MDILSFYLLLAALAFMSGLIGYMIAYPIARRDAERERTEREMQIKAQTMWNELMKMGGIR
jgi:hypothetical protein